MADYAYFYNSENGDRKYDADSFSDWLKKFFTTGVFADDLFVESTGDMKISVATGYANIGGKVRLFDAIQSFTIATPDATYDRIDTVVVERNDTDRNIVLKLVKGDYSTNPVPTEPVREGNIYQLVLAEIYVAAGAVRITQANITDKRTDTDVCGIVAGTVTEMDFSQFSEQFDAYYEEFKEGNEEDFVTWFDNIKGQLSTDAAGHLQNEIDDLTDAMEQSVKVEGGWDEYYAIPEAERKSGKSFYVKTQANQYSAQNIVYDADENVSVADAISDLNDTITNVVGYVDTSNVIKTLTSSGYNNTVLTYTATEDCWVMAKCYAQQYTSSSNKRALAYLNEIQIVNWVNGSLDNNAIPLIMPIKKGQTIKFGNTSYVGYYEAKFYKKLF